MGDMHVPAVNLPGCNSHPHPDQPGPSTNGPMVSGFQEAVFGRGGAGSSK